MKVAGSIPAVPTKLLDLVAQLVEQRPFKAWVVGSSPTGITACEANAATIAQLVEQRICNASVAGSSPASGSRLKTALVP